MLDILYVVLNSLSDSYAKGYKHGYKAVWKPGMRCGIELNDYTKGYEAGKAERIKLDCGGSIWYTG